jgi:nicotinamidase/pyrazinamidase
MNKRALIIVDPQKCFMPGGSLAVPNGDEILGGINRILMHRSGFSPRWRLIVVTQDWHPEDHCSFKKQGGPWSAHGVQGSTGAEFHDDLVFGRGRIGDIVVVQKGVDKEVDSYSAFFDNERKGKTELDDRLKRCGVDEVFVCGLATDYCVKATVLDALDLRLKTTVLIDACRAVNVNPGDEKKALVEMANGPRNGPGARLAVVEDIFR